MGETHLGVQDVETPCREEEQSDKTQLGGQDAKVDKAPVVIGGGGKGLPGWRHWAGWRGPKRGGGRRR
jgi:hypothetical protein